MSGDGKEKVSDTSKFSRNLNVPDIFIDKNLFIFFLIHLFFFLFSVLTAQILAHVHEASS